MIFKKSVITISCLWLTATHASEREHIYQVLQEIHYTKEVVKRLKAKYRGSGKVRFNYDALIAQLSAAEQGIKPYLNNKITEIHTKPPKPLTLPLFKVRKN